MKQKLNNKGFTVVELTVSFIFVFMIAFSMYQLLYNYRVKQNEESIKSQMIDYKNQITLAIQNDINEKKLKYIDYCTEGGARTSRCIVLHFNDNTSKQLSVEEREKVYEDIDKPQLVNYISYGGTVYESTDAVLLEYPSGQMLYNSADSDYDETELIEDDEVEIYKISIPIYHNDLEGNYGISIVATGYNYNYDEEAENPIEGESTDPADIPIAEDGSRVYKGYITIEPSTQINNYSTSVTTIARIKFDGNNLDKYQQIIGNMQFGGSSLSLVDGSLCLETYLIYYHKISSNFSNFKKQLCNNDITIESDKFYTLVGVVNYVDGSINLYIYDDAGNQLGNSKITLIDGENVATSNLNFAIGGNPGSVIHTNFFYGTISDAIVYNAPIDSETISSCINKVPNKIDRTCLNEKYGSNKLLDHKFRND